jgi:hypothetical protein
MEEKGRISILCQIKFKDRELVLPRVGSLKQGS